MAMPSHCQLITTTITVPANCSHHHPCQHTTNTTATLLTHHSNNSHNSHDNHNHDHDGQVDHDQVGDNGYNDGWGDSI